MALMLRRGFQIERLLSLFIISLTMAFINGADETSQENQLKVEIVEKVDDCDVTSQKGNVLKVHYTGRLTDGTQFDSSRDHGNPISFQLGAGQVIKGWDMGMIDMCVGEKRKLIIPPHLGYGDKGAGDKIPGGATLVFDVELVQIDEGQKPQNVFKDIDLDDDNLLSQDEVSGYIRKQEDDQGIDKTDDEAHNAMIADIFLHEDKDKDGFISHEEFSGPKHEEL